MGLHARPAGKLAKAVKVMDSTVTLSKGNGKTTSARKLMSIMVLGVKTGETVTVTIEYGDEKTNVATVEEFFRENL